MISDFLSTDTGSSLRSTYEMFTQPPSPIGAAEDGVTGIPFEKTSGEENSENYTSSKAGSASIRWYTKLTTSEPTGCGVEGKQLQEKMKKEWRRYLMKSSEDLFANFAKKNQE
jgi:hypothetical protein